MVDVVIVGIRDGVDLKGSGGMPSEAELSMQDDVFSDCSPIFVVGAPRSGTTLLERMLDSHPNIAIADEIIFFDIILKARELVPNLGTPERIDRFFDLLPSMDHVRYWNNVEEVLHAVKSRLLADPHASYGRFYRYFMEAWAERSGACRFGEKTPWNVRHLGRLLDMFPNCRILHVVRDPRAVVASKRALPRTSTDVITNALKWLIDVAEARRVVCDDPRSEKNILEVRYEDLVSDPGSVLRRVCAFVDEPFDEGMLAFSESKNVMFRNQSYQGGVFKPVFDRSIEAWRKSLGASQVLLIEKITAPMMRFYGYELTSSAPSDMLRLPRQLFSELQAWRAFKRAERQLFREEPEIRFRSNSRVQFAVLRSLLARHLRSYLRKA